MKRLAGILVLAFIISTCAFARQGASAPAKWIGTWKLNVAKSTFATTLVPGVPADLKIVSEILGIERTGATVTISTNMVAFFDGSSHPIHQTFSLALNGKPTVFGPISLHFQPIDDSRFDLLSEFRSASESVREVSHFAVSSDAKTLTETKIQRETTPSAQAGNGGKGAPSRAAKFILVFTRQPEGK